MKKFITKIKASIRIFKSYNFVLLTETEKQRENDEFSVVSDCCCDVCRFSLLDNAMVYVDRPEKDPMEELDEILKNANISKN